MITAKNIRKHELIGLEVVVKKSKNQTQEDIAGTVIDETQNTLKIESKDGEKTVPKKDSVFIFKLESGPVQVSGEEILARPEERIRKGD